jgi:gluconokinase
MVATRTRPAVHLVVMGVAGVGKSTTAEHLAADLDLDLAEGDDFHPDANIAKMSSGQALTDEDRWPWLDALADWTARRRAAGRSTVLTCSALKSAYRDVLRAPVPETFFVHLYGDEGLLHQRMEGRREHFMPAALLRSQLETLEPLGPDEYGIAVDVVLSMEAILARVKAALQDE